MLHNAIVLYTSTLYTLCTFSYAVSTNESRLRSPKRWGLVDKETTTHTIEGLAVNKYEYFRLVYLINVVVVRRRRCKLDPSLKAPPGFQTLTVLKTTV